MENTTTTTTPSQIRDLASKRAAAWATHSTAWVKYEGFVRNREWAKAEAMQNVIQRYAKVCDEIERGWASAWAAAQGGK